MKTLYLALFGLAMGAAPVQDDAAEAKKKRLAELIHKMAEIQGEAQKLMNELTGGDRSKENAVMMEVMKKYAPKHLPAFVGSALAANERNASVTLKTFASAQADFRANDRDANRVNDFWVADVSGLYRVASVGSGGREIRLIERAGATADAHPAVPVGKMGVLPGAKGRDASVLVSLGKASPKAGYWFAVIKQYEDEAGAAKKYDMGNGRCTSRYGICAYPAEYGKTGNRTFIISEYNTVYAKDTQGKAPAVFPANPRRAGWSKLD